MSRSLKKPFFVEEKLFNRIEAMNASGDKKVIKPWSRASTIFPEFVGHTIAVHDGHKHMSSDARFSADLPGRISSTEFPNSARRSAIVPSSALSTSLRRTIA